MKIILTIECDEETAPDIIDSLRFVADAIECDGIKTKIETDVTD